MKRKDLKLFNPWGKTKFTHNHLPHWQQNGATYFVTWRLKDSIPQPLLNHHYDARDAWRSRHPKPWDDVTEAKFHRMFSQELDDLMDEGHGACLLRKPENAQLVKSALEFFEEKRCHQISWVTMPNHVHALFQINPNFELEQLIHSWKLKTSSDINRREKLSGNLWQKDYFDRMIRDQNHFANCVRYIRKNPIKAQLREGEYLLFESDLAKEID